MDTVQEIAIIDLLCRREAELVKVALAEEAVCKLLGGLAFPFPPPPDLPSRRKVPAKPKTRVAVVLPENPLPGMRKLESPDENAYRLLYRFHGEDKESFQADYDFLKLLLNFPAESFQLLSIETVFFCKPGDWQLRHVLWQASTEKPSND